MKLVFLCLFVLIINMAWRHISKEPSVTKYLHSLPGSLPRWLQWHTGLFGSLSLLMLYIVQNILRHQIIGTHGAKPYLEDMNIPHYLKVISLLSPVMAVISFILVLFHSRRKVEQYAVLNTNNGDNAEHGQWQTTNKQDMVLWIIAMPAIFIVMSLQSTVRAWMLLDCTNADGTAQVFTSMCGLTYQRAVIEGLFEENLDLAQLCQYYVIVMFVRLCWHIISRELKGEGMAEARSMVKYAAFQGVHAWILVGSITLIIQFSYTYFYAHRASNFPPEEAAAFKSKYTYISKTLDTVFVPFTFLCIYNMLLICNMNAVKAQLKNANLKFLGTRMLLLISQIQLKVLMNIVYRYDFSDPAKFATAPYFIQAFELTEDRARLFHSSLLGFECLIIVIFNYCAWEVGVDHSVFGEFLMEKLLDT